MLGINLGYDGKMKENIVKKGVFAILNQSFDIMIKDQFDADRELFQLRDQNDTLILHQMKIYSEGTFDMDSIETMISQGFKQTVEFIQNNSVFLEPFKMREEEKNNPDLRKLVKKVY
ncbi:MAG: hypothetical protein U9Q15_02000 [Patescibacteria group bacterium]|nr:hypothetical protein [Patescibacteria group bacterium]